MARPKNEDRQNMASTRTLVRMLNRQLNAGFNFSTQDVREMLDDIDEDSEPADERPQEKKLPQSAEKRTLPAPPRMNGQ
jgi:hypothetical protein